MSKTTTHSAEISNENRSTTPTTERFTTYIRSQWADDAREIPAARPAAPYAAQRRSTLSEQFTGKRLVIEAGLAKQRSNDTFYIFRAHSAFSHLTGWGADALPGSILVLEPNASGHDATLFFPESAGKDTDEFFANPTVGEFWTGKRPSLAQVAGNLGLNTRSLAEFASEPGDVTLANADLARAVSELRLVKDEYEIEQMREAVMATEQGFNAVIEAFPRATQHPRGERVVEGAFGMQARLDGNGVGYETIAASGPHACTLHWEKNNGAVLEGDLLLLDAGIELDSLYTADITRTLPISGTFSPVQRKVYEAVLEAADAAHAIVRPGITFHEVHDTAMAVIERKTREWGFLPEKEEGDETPYHRRYMVHGTSHHLGLDVHDCAQAKRELYMDGVLEPGMVFTIEPGLYFQPEDLTVPEEFRGIGVRIEDDIVVTETGHESLSAHIPRTADDVEAWVQRLNR
ncbi:aminopeptidase P family protein [Leucobacter sp. UCMA 4100]|uniref:aminopeptidase P family protein n=1 Tax=Leucobacter sp. UCMA 4100 TaxID=2810534 RepID=UPI0022EAB7CD|nr:aminopeptidase P family protein [Leucobacter sp. UCMA 4100]MDA3146064.1 aminopeptidase P family protein [Leucobacter sp. UCMA 4100]